MTINDAWRPTRYLTLTPAISHVCARGSNSGGGSVLQASAFAPAVSAAWDATHDGRTVLRGSYNQYVDINIFDIARHTLGDQVRKRCKWSDDRQAFDSECEYSGGAASNTVGLGCSPTGFDVNGRPCREPLGIPRVYEYTAGGERELVQGVALALDFVYKEFQQPVRDPGDQPDLEHGGQHPGLHRRLPQRPQRDHQRSADARRAQAASTGAPPWR